MHHAGKCVPLTRSLARTQTHTQTHTHTPARSHTCMCALHRRCPTPLAAGGLAHRRAIKREQAGVVLGASGAGLPGRVPRARCGSPRAADTHHSLHWPSWYFSLLGRDNTACVALTHKSAACARGPEGDGLRVRKIARAGRRQAACTCAVRSTRVRAAHRHAPPSPRPRATYVTWRGPPLGQRALGYQPPLYLGQKKTHRDVTLFWFVSLIVERLAAPRKAAGAPAGARDCARARRRARVR